MLEKICSPLYNLIFSFPVFPSEPGAPLGHKRISFCCADVIMLVNKTHAGNSVRGNWTSIDLIDELTYKLHHDWLILFMCYSSLFTSPQVTFFRSKTLHPLSIPIAMRERGGDITTIGAQIQRGVGLSKN